MAACTPVARVAAIQSSSREGVSASQKPTRTQSPGWRQSSGREATEKMYGSFREGTGKVQRMQGGDGIQHRASVSGAPALHH